MEPQPSKKSSWFRVSPVKLLLINVVSDKFKGRFVPVKSPGKKEKKVTLLFKV